MKKDYVVLCMNAARDIYPYTLNKSYDELKSVYRKSIDQMTEDILLRIKNNVDQAEETTINLFEEIYRCIGKKYNLADGLLSHLIMKLSYGITDYLTQGNETQTNYYDYWALDEQGQIVIHIYDKSIKRSTSSRYSLHNDWLRHITAEAEEKRKDEIAPRVDKFFEMLSDHEEDGWKDMVIVVEEYYEILVQLIDKEEVALSHGLCLTWYIDTMQNLLTKRLREKNQYAKAVWYIDKEESASSPRGPLVLLIELRGIYRTKV